MSPFSREPGFCQHLFGTWSSRLEWGRYQGISWLNMEKTAPPNPQQPGFKKASFQEMDLNLKELGSGGVFETVLRQAVVVAAISAWT